VLFFVGGQPLTGCYYRAGHLEPSYQPMIKKAKPFLSVLQQIRDMTGCGGGAPPGAFPRVFSVYQGLCRNTA
jgi:hypothetical protein